MKKEIVNFIIILACLIISLMLLWEMGVFCDEYNMTPALVCGSFWGLILYWLRIFLLMVLSILSAIRIIKLIYQRRR